MRTAIALLAVVVSFGAAEGADLERARDLYSRTEYAQAMELLSAGPRNAEALELIGRCQYMMGDAKKASESLQKAVDLMPDSAEYHLWLGRAYGRRAETATFITAPGLAVKARDQFELAVKLAPRNGEALSDLFEYYLDAPGFLGGGLDKADALAERIGELDAAEGHYAQARLAEKRKQFQTAEQQLRRATDVAPRQVGRLIDLAKFLAKSGRYQESDEAFQRAEKLAPNAPKLMFERASVYVRTRRNLDTARDLLKRYLQAQLTPDDPPRREAEELLKQASSS
jgi:tetratricopeptide (TPR) repeat protein